MLVDYNFFFSLCVSHHVWSLRLLFLLGIIRKMSLKRWFRFRSFADSQCFFPILNGYYEYVSSDDMNVLCERSTKSKLIHFHLKMSWQGEDVFLLQNRNVNEKKIVAKEILPSPQPPSVSEDADGRALNLNTHTNRISLGITYTNEKRFVNHRMLTH